ncbi:carboxymuconolactone decarboxylase family protein [Roseococcus sp. SYP-B2431]|uniref:carboxymuconolactone decarboxylase family protein n=1 Tax=Roseococcus sp. SYP-B2431 TaxID=2496640 RepID=UPI00103C7848|nr:carboxymuconolactone decarboxylase family protein [Roseococcus sp. SYP-B2431]TCH99873.1 carboxymuconolactone decarboxylase family protein [Roseococcus sp. SYP-B2431]
MARLPYLDPKDLAEADRPLLKRMITLHRCLVNSPGAARAFSGLGQYIRYGMKLDARLRELAILQVGWLARSPYEWSHHVKIGYDFGVTDEDIAALIAETEGRPNGLEPLAKLVLKGAREVYAGGMSPETFAELQKHFDNEAMVDLTVTAAFYCAVVRTLASLAIDVEPEYQKYLEKYPFPG